ncbi:hypothetical protein GCM10007859_07530 [Brevundimonas denitrificans]|uniref:Uncharacterized protein n=1 Tax=Brevundimonas denitrificans TaxID=1443434 RepID=A0ABQ6BFE2_9CAUL|nr:hypothetical protein GCM10007859_07530 [Brevundimonas denitrificans]
MAGLVEIPVRGRGGGRGRGGVLESVEPGAILDRDPGEHGFERGDLGGRERFHIATLPDTGLPTVKAAIGG